MEFIIVLIISIFTYIILYFIFGNNLNEIKRIAKNEELDKITAKYPNNIEICKEYLKKLKNENINIKEDKNSNATVYLVSGNKIFIGNLHNNFTRIQTIAHECLHSVQSKKMLWFNFIFSNIYIIYFVIICILAIFKVLPDKNLFMYILILFGFIFYCVRSYLEMDAMIKARFLAKEYMEEKNISTKEEINKIIKEYDKLNDVGIKTTNFQFIQNVLIKNVIFAIICIIR